MDPFVRDYKSDDFDTDVVSIEEYNSIHFQQNDLRIFHQNIRSAARNLDELRVFLECLTVQFDVIVLTETFQVKDLSIYKLHGYNVMYNEGSVNKNDGVMVFVREDLNCESCTMELSRTMALVVDIHLQHLSVKITSIYRSHDIVLSDFNQALLVYLNRTEQTKHHIIIGDLNIDLLSKTPLTEEYKNIMNASGYISLINKVTRPISKTCLDHIFIRMNPPCHLPIRSFIFNQSITDHSPIAMLLHLHQSSKQKTEPMFKKYINFQELRKDLQREMWLRMYEENNVDAKTDAFCETLGEHIRRNTKIVKMQRNPSCARKVWNTKELIRVIDQKNTLYRLTLINPNDTEMKKEYTVLRNKVSILIKIQKQKYFESLIKKANNNTSKAVWDCVKDVCNSKLRNTEIGVIETENGQNVTDRLEIANLFNDYYSHIGEKYANNITPPQISPNEHKYFQENTIYLSPTNPVEVYNTINELKSRKSPGMDEIRSETLKEVSYEIMQPLCHLANYCLEKGQFPAIFKIGVIRPIYKSGNRKKFQITGPYH